MDADEKQRIRREQKVDDCLETLTKIVCEIKAEMSESRKETIAILDAVTKKNNKRNNWILASFLTAIAVMFTGIIGYINNNSKNSVTLEQIDKNKAEKRCLNHAADWLKMVDPDKQRAAVYYDVVRQPPEVTRGGKN